jgi:hypothetical protein
MQADAAGRPRKSPRREEAVINAKDGVRAMTGAFSQLGAQPDSM